MSADEDDGSYLIVTTSHDNEDAAKALARSAVEGRFAACAQVSGSVHSVYWWEGEIAEEREWIITFKTTAERVDDLADHVVTNHPYETPELVATPIVAGGADYLAWLREETDEDEEEEDEDEEDEDEEDEDEEDD